MYDLKANINIEIEYHRYSAYMRATPYHSLVRGRDIISRRCAALREELDTYLLAWLNAEIARRIWIRHTVLSFQPPASPGI